MLIRRMYLPIKCECVAFIFQNFSLSLFTEIRKKTVSAYSLHYVGGFAIIRFSEAVPVCIGILKNYNPFLQRKKGAEIHPVGRGNDGERNTFKTQLVYDLFIQFYR